LSTGRESLPGVAAAVRQALAARTNDQHLIDDLTQEALARLADTEHTLSPDGERAYAVVIARNLLASHYRGESVRGRHAHRLVDRAGSDDPAQLTIDKEETEALASALTHLDPAERDLLVRHVVTGADLATLAGEGNVSRGAIAMRLARARANLRLEFLLVFRRVELPTDRCRPVLLAMAVGDVRRQAQLDAAGHIEQCPVCAELVEPMTQHDRRIAGWLFVPLVEGARRAWRAIAGHPVRAASVALVAVGATGLVVAADRSPETADRPTIAEAPSSSEVMPTTTTTAATTTAAPAPAPVPPPPPSAVPTEPAAPETSPPATAPPCPAPAPLDEIDLTAALGCPFALTVVSVTGLSGADGFTAVTAGGVPVSVRLAGAPSLPIPLAPALQVSVVGTISSAPDPLVVDVAAGDVQLGG
jgi:RNA polymerase sigma factor (sigma-70 family)